MGVVSPTIKMADTTLQRVTGGEVADWPRCERWVWMWWWECGKARRGVMKGNRARSESAENKHRKMNEGKRKKKGIETPFTRNDSPRKSSEPTLLPSHPTL